MNIQKQAGAKDCGLFAIANAVSMAMGEDPFNKEFDQGSLRRQFVNSIEQGLTKPFISMDPMSAVFLVSKYRLHICALSS